MMEMSFPDNENGWVIGVGGQVLKIDNDPVSIRQEKFIIDSLSIKIFPNPASSRLYLQIGLTQTEIVSFQLFNINGHKVQERKLGTLRNGAYQYEIYVDQLPPGIYVAVIKTTGSIDSKKLIIY
jgi:hypothetical protein